MSDTLKPTKAIKGMPDDNVAVILNAARTGELIQTNCDGNIESLTCAEDIPPFHKVATAQIGLGEAVIRRGTQIGVATLAIKTGELVHVHNIKSQRAQTGAA